MVVMLGKTDSPDKRAGLGYKEGGISLILNLLLFALKLYAGMISASVALVADAWHTLSDSLTSVMVIVGIRLSFRKPDEKHPFGHGRWEQLSALAIALMLVLVGVEFVRDSCVKLRGHETADFGWVAYVVTLVSVLVKEGLARYAFYVGRITGNASVKADAWHHRSDALSSLVVLAGLVFGRYFWWIDAVLGMMVSLMLFYVAIGIVRGAINKILGERPSEVLVEKVMRIVCTEMGERACPHHFHIHEYGAHTEFTFHVKVPGEETVREAHAKATLVEQKIRQEMHIETTIHVEPLEG